MDSFDRNLIGVFMVCMSIFLFVTNYRLNKIEKLLTPSSTNLVTMVELPDVELADAR